MLSWVLDQPDCDTTRLVYADWLQENEQEEMAAFVRSTPPSPLDCFDIRMRVLLPCMEAIGEDCRVGNATNGSRLGFGTRSSHKHSIEWTWHMGYPSEISIPKFAFVEVGPRIVRHWPIRRVTFTDIRSERSILRRYSTWKDFDLSSVYARELVPDSIFALYAGPHSTQAPLDLERLSTSALQWARRKTSDS